MKPLRRLTNLLAACAVTAAAFGQPALAAELAGDPFIKQNINRENFEPGGKYHLFGSRGALAERTGSIGLEGIQSNQMGNLLIQQATIKGNLGYTVRFSGHGHEVHSPFDNHASRSASDEQGNPVNGFTLYKLEWSGHEHHPADGYDGPQGGGYPAPKGARDIYSYDVKGIAQNISLNITDNRSTQQRLTDRFDNAGRMLTQGIGDGYRRATEYNPALNKLGNAAEAINGSADIIKNVIGAAGEIIGAGDAVQGIGAGIDIATMHGLDLLSTENKIKAVSNLGGLSQFQNNATETVRDWAVRNPNAAQGAEALGNIAKAIVPVTKGAEYARTRYDWGGIGASTVKQSQMGAVALPKGKAPVGENFSQAQQGRYSYDSPYHSRTVRTELEQRYGKQNVKSSTVPPSNGKNVKLANQSHPKTGVPFDSKGFPNFEKDVKYDTRINTKEFRSKGSTGQMRLATKDLAEAIQKGQVRKSSFNTEQLRAIEKGESKIPDYTWHHHQDTGRMQLVPEKSHHDTGHIGWEAMNKGR